MSNVVGSVLITLDIQDRASAGYVRAANTAARAGTNLRNATVAHNRAMSDAFTRTAAAVSVLHGPLGGVASRIASIGTLARHSSMSMAGLALAAGGAGFALTGFLKTADRMRLMENQLKTVTTGVSNLRDMERELLEASQRSRASLAASVTIYARTARATEHLGLSQQKLVRITETVQKAFAIGGASAAEAQGAAIQLSQGIASDRFSGDEFRSVAENAPVLLREMGKALGVNIGKLREMAHNGELTADVVTKSILDASDEIDHYFNMTEATIGQAWTMIRNEADMFVHDLDTAYGITRAIATAGVGLANNFEDAATWALRLAAATAVFTAGRIGAAAVGRKTDEGATGIRNVIGRTMSEGLFYGTRDQAKKAKNAALADMREIRAARMRNVADIAKLESDSAQKLINMRMAHERKLVAARNQAAVQHKNVNSLAEHRVTLTANLASAQAGVVQQLKLERQEALKAVRVAGSRVGGATTRFAATGKKGDLRALEKEQRALNSAREKYRVSTERLAVAEAGAFNDARVRKYAAEVRNVESQIKTNSAALTDAQRRFMAADAAYVKAQREGAVYLAAARAEREKTAKQVATIAARQDDLNKKYAAAATSLRVATGQMTLMGAAMMRLSALGSGIWSLLGGGPGIAIMAIIGGFLSIQNSIANSRRETEEWIQKLVDAGYLAEDVAEKAKGIDDALESKNASRLREELAGLEAQMQKMQRGSFWASLGFSFGDRGVDQIIQEVTSSIENLQRAVAAAGEGAVVPSVVSERIADYERFVELMEQSRAGEITAEAAREMQGLADKHNELDKLNLEFRKTVQIVSALGTATRDTKIALDSLGQGDEQDRWNLQEQMRNLRTLSDMRRREVIASFSEESIALASLTKEQERHNKVKAQLKKEYDEFIKKNTELRSVLPPTEEMWDDLTKSILFHQEVSGMVSDSQQRLLKRAEELTEGLVKSTLDGTTSIQDMRSAMEEMARLNPDLSHWISQIAGVATAAWEAVRAQKAAAGAWTMQESKGGRTRHHPGIPQTPQTAPIPTLIPDDFTRAEWAAGTKQKLSEAEQAAKKLKEGMEALRLEARASQLDEFNQKVVQHAQSFGIATKEIEAYIDAIATGNLESVPQIFHDIAKELEAASNNELFRKIEELKLESLTMSLSDVDRELVNLAQSAGYSLPRLMEIVNALRSGDTDKLGENIRRLREQLKKTAEDKKIKDFVDDLANAFGDFFRSAISGSEGFEDALISLGKRIADLIIELLIIMPLINALKSAFGSAFGLSDGGGVGYFPPAPGGGGSVSLHNLSSGGRVFGPGSATSDSIPAMLSNGEYVIRASQTAKYLPLIQAINDDRLPELRSGGGIGRMPAISGGSGGLSGIKIEVIDRNNTKVTAGQTRQDANGDFTMELILDQITEHIAKSVENGQIGSVMRHTYGLKRTTR